jgi:hypothetical protein
MNAKEFPRRDAANLDAHQGDGVDRMAKNAARLRSRGAAESRPVPSVSRPGIASGARPIL